MGQVPVMIQVPMSILISQRSNNVAYSTSGKM